jgi:hypothetical protein
LNISWGSSLLMFKYRFAFLNTLQSKRKRLGHSWQYLMEVRMAFTTTNVATNISLTLIVKLESSSLPLHLAVLDLDNEKVH